jgi:nicotinamidase-related amidase
VIEATPYPWPYDCLPAPGRMALVLVNPQAGNAWMDPTGRVREACLTLQAEAHNVGMLVCGIRATLGPATPRRLAAIPAAGTQAWELLPHLACDLLVDAPALDGFFQTGLHQTLWPRGIRHLVLAGFGTEGAIHSTLRSANDRGYECLVLEDACAPLDPSLQTAAISTIAMSGGIFGAYTSSDRFLAALLNGDRGA